MEGVEETMKTKVKKLVPRYMSQFSCTGSECEDTCCAGWHVTIDRKTYKKYQKISIPSLKKEVERSILRNKVDPSDTNYAYIKMDHNIACPFMDGDKLCSIQKNLGENMLSTTCTQYPRTNNLVHGVIETSATASCPEIARIALLNPGGIEFDEVEEESDLHLMSKVVSKDSLNPLDGLFWNIRIFTISLLQNRAYDLADRMILLGLFCDEVDVHIQHKNTSAILSTIESFQKGIETRQYDQELNVKTINIVSQIKLLIEIFLMHSGDNMANRFLECLADFDEGLGMTENKDVTMEEIAIQYNQLYETKYKPYMEEKEYILENYLVNIVFSSTFPRWDKPLFDSYTDLVSRYSLIKTLLIGVSGAYRELVDSLTIKVIQTFSRKIDHNKVYLQKMTQTLEANGVKNIHYMKTLLKN